MNYCVNCVWCRDHTGFKAPEKIERAYCFRPGRRYDKTLTTLKAVAGDSLDPVELAIKAAQDAAFFCTNERGEGRVWATVLGECGRGGRWFEEKGNG